MVSYIRRVMSISWLATTMLIKLEIPIHVDQLLDMCSSLVQKQYLGAVKDSQQYLYQQKKLSIEQERWQLKRACG